jgi:hypothetical protein
VVVGLHQIATIVPVFVWKVPEYKALELDPRILFL